MENTAMHSIPKPIFDRKLNYGNVIQIILLAIMILGWGYSMVRWQGTIEAQLKTVIDAQTQAAKNALDKERENEALTSNDRLQDERISLINRTLLDIQQTQRTQNETLNKISTSIAVIEVRSAKDSAN